MQKTRNDAISAARVLAKNLTVDKLVKAVILWGSILDLKDNDSVSSDVDLLVMVSDLRPYYCDTKSMSFGLPTRYIESKGFSFDLVFVDYAFLSEAVKSGHWTVLDALRRGIQLISDPMLNNLRNLSEEARPLAISTVKDWLDQAAALLKKSQRSLDREEYAQSIILARDASHAAIYALIYKLIGRPPSPNTILSDAKAVLGTWDIWSQFLEIHDLERTNRDQAILVQLQTHDFINKVLKMSKSE